MSSPTQYIAALRPKVSERVRSVVEGLHAMCIFEGRLGICKRFEKRLDGLIKRFCFAIRVDVDETLSNLFSDGSTWQGIILLSRNHFEKSLNKVRLLLFQVFLRYIQRMTS